MLKRTVLTVIAAVATLAFAASAHAAYLNVGTTNLGNATTTLYGNPAGAEFLAENTNGASGAAFGLYGLLTATSPTAGAAAVRAANNSTNGYGYGVFGTQAGSGTGVFGSTPSGRGVWGNTTSGIGVRGASSSGTGVFASSSSGIGVVGQHLAATGTVPGVSASTNSTAADADALVGTVTPTSPGLNSEGVRGVNNGTGANGIGVYGQQNGSGYGVYGYSPSGRGVAGFSGSWQGVFGHSNSQAGVVGESGSFDGVWGQAHSGTAAGVSGHNDNATGGYGVYGGSPNGYGVMGDGGAAGVRGVIGSGSGSGDAGVLGRTNAELGAGVEGLVGNSNGGLAIYGKDIYALGWAGYFDGNVNITAGHQLDIGGGCVLGCSSAQLRIDDPLDPAHRYLQHASVASSQQLDVYSGNVTTNGKGFATVTMPSWFQALNRSFRYQLTIVGGRGWNARVVKPLADNRFTIQSDQPKVKVSWQLTAVRHDRYANANPARVIVEKPKADRGKYVHPEVYGKPRSDGIGYQKPPTVPRKPVVKR
jgi:hypothetical protein